MKKKDKEDRVGRRQRCHAAGTWRSTGGGGFEEIVDASRLPPHTFFRPWCVAPAAENSQKFPEIPQEEKTAKNSRELIAGPIIVCIPTFINLFTSFIYKVVKGINEYFITAI